MPIIGKLLLSKSDGVPFGGFMVFVDPIIGRTFKERDNTDHLEGIFTSDGEEGSLWMAGGVILSEIRKGKNVYLVINDQDDHDNYALEAILKCLGEEGEDDGEY